MSYYTFEACRVSGDGNAIFPAEIIIDDEEEVLIYRKPKLIGAKETRAKFGAIGSITVDKHILFADIIVETKGGREIVAQGISREDADRMKILVGGLIIRGI